MNSSEVLLLASATCSASFYVVSAVLTAIRRSPAPPTLPATSDLGPESPAVANLMANGGTLTPDAVPATLLDLAARRVVEIDEAEPKKYECRIGAAAPAGLTPYESRVFELVRGKAAGGAVPAMALTLGEQAQAKRWQRGFGRDVINEARRAGLTTPRWPPQVQTALGLLLLGAFGFVALAANDSDNQSLLWFVTLAFALATIWISTKIFQDDSQLITQAGLPDQARWLSLRKYLHDDELFADLPPTAVVVRERYLAYGAALGVAAAAVRAIPMGAENDRRAWSSFGGRWRQVTVSYPTSWPPAFGSSPGEAIWRGIRIGVFGGFWLWVSSLVLSHLNFGPQTDQLSRDLSAGAVVVGAIALVVVGVGSWLVLAGLVSLFGASQVTGDAVRVRQFGGEDSAVCYLAVDDGTRDHIRAWKVSPAIYAALTEYSTVTVSVTPLLGYVRSVHRAPLTVTPAPVGAATIS